jgi:hypothetical protein
MESQNSLRMTLLVKLMVFFACVLVFWYCLFTYMVSLRVPQDFPNGIDSFTQHFTPSQ